MAMGDAAGPVKGRGPLRVAIAVVCLALAAVAFAAWRPAVTGGSTGSPAVTARATPTAKATTSLRATAAVDPDSGLHWVDEASLPAPARRVLAQIDRGGPYDYDKDGTTFRNAEGLLPKAAAGYYREYTVVLPGSADRGPVRIIVGGRTETFYWTTDHYASFSRIRR